MNMGTFNTDKTNAKANQSNVDKDKPTPEEVKAADESTSQVETPAANPQEPLTVTEESASETADRHVASTELPVERVTPIETQAAVEGLLDDEGKVEDENELREVYDEERRDPSTAYGLKIAGAATGPHVDGTVRNDAGKVAFAPPGTLNAAMAGVQMDAAGHVDSIGTDNSSKSGTRI
jgi:hypothetical protein